MADAKRIWEKLESFYSEPHRHYHTLAHIRYCLQQLDDCRPRLQHPEEVEMALWFHDVIYDVERRDNELCSSRLLEECLRNSWPEASLQRTLDLVVVTEHRREPVDNDQRYMCDIDLAGFGKPWPAFLQDSMALARENPHLDRATFASGKLAFLNALARRQFIYRTEFYQQKYETLARANIDRYVQMLEQGLVSGDDTS